MKHCYTLLLLMWCSLAGAQTDFRFADSTAHWNSLRFYYHFMCAPDMNTTDFYACGDTVANGRSYQKICSSSAFEAQVVRVDSTKKVFALKQGNDTLIYDFGRISGDTFSISGLVWKVDSVDTVVIVKPRKRMYVTPVQYQWSQDVWIENIGSLYSYLWQPVVRAEILDGDGNALLCYTENGVQIFQNNAWDTCYYYSVCTGIGEIDSKRVSVHMVSNSALAIYSDIHHTIQLNLYDLTGRLILQKELTEQTTRVDLGDMAQGVYVYSIQSDKQKIKTGKLLIE